MTAPNWTPLREALARTRAAQLNVPLWWRDDDAIAPTPALDHLATLAGSIGIPVHLAVIPAGATEALATYCTEAPLIPVVHGWAHYDHSQADEKKNEFMTARAGAVGDAARGLTRMQEMFTTQLQPMFVPPWNRINANVVGYLSTQGYTTLSTFGGRHAQQAAPGLTQINTHVDPILWKGNRDLVDPEQLIAQTAQILTDRCDGCADAQEPLGLLTHHLVHTPAIWAFAHDFLTEMLSGGATPWTMENTT